MSTRGGPGSSRNAIVYEEKVNRKGEHFYQPYYVGRLLGKGGFANCHEVTAAHDPNKYAIKIVPKAQDYQKRIEANAKVKEEVEILRSMDHPGVVKFITYFDDHRNHYIIMELCIGGSLSDVIKRRKTLTEPEVRYLLVQMVEIMKYVRSRHIIHRDIKLANYFLDENYRLKLGDFGLATQNIDSSRLRRKFCGTPNYVAPEMIERKLYGYQVDAWSTGILTYTLLIGRPPFETKNCKDTYEKIKTCSFQFPVGKCSEAAKNFIRKLLWLDPTERLKFEEFMDHPFIYNYNIPRELEASFPVEPPSRNFTKEYARAVRSKKLDPVPEREIVTLTPIKPRTTPREITPPTKAEAKATYRNVLRSPSNPKMKQIEWQSIEGPAPDVKVEENLCKQEEQPALELVIKKQEPAPEVPEIFEKSVQKKEEPEYENEEDPSTNLFGRKRFQANQEAKVQIEQTHKKVKPKVEKCEEKLVLLPAPQQKEANCWMRPKLKLRLKEVPEALKAASEEKEVKIMHWQYCSKQFGVAYVLSTHEIGIYFDDRSCLQLSPRDSMIGYFCRVDGQEMRRDFKLGEVEGLRSSETQLFAKVKMLLHYTQVLQAKLPLTEDKLEQDITISSIGDCVPAPPYVRSISKAEGMVIFRLSNGNNHFYFNDGSSMFLSLSSYCLSYREGDKLTVHTIPLNNRTLDAGFKEKAKLVCSHYDRLVRGSPGEGSERWLLKEERRQTPKKEACG